jgi:hypothetical protein
MALTGSYIDEDGVQHPDAYHRIGLMVVSKEGQGEYCADFKLYISPSKEDRNTEANPIGILSDNLNYVGTLDELWDKAYQRATETLTALASERAAEFDEVITSALVGDAA